MRFSKLLLAVSLFLFSFQSVHAQSQKGIPSDGRDFYIAELVPSIKCNAVKPFQGFFALVSSYYDCNVTVSYFDPNSSPAGQEIPTAPQHIVAKHGLQISLDQGYMNPRDNNGDPLAPNGEQPIYACAHVHADRPISLTYYSTGPNSGGQYLALQTGALGKTYVICASPANPSLGHANSHHFACTPDSSSSIFCIIAVTDNTTVKITPNGLTRGGHIGVNFGSGANGHPNPWTVKLNRGQVYWVKSTIDDPDNDLSGSIVEADQPVGVLAGNEGQFNGETSFAAFGGDQRDLAVEQMMPVDYWTSDGYVSMPFMDCPGGPPDDGSAGDQYKVFTYDTTMTTLSAFIDPIGARNPTLSRYQFPIFDNCDAGVNFGSVNGQKIFVEQYDYRAQYSTTEPFTAPSQQNVIPLDRCRTQYMWYVPDDKAQVHKRRYVNVIAQRTMLSKIRMSHNGGALVSINSYPSAGGGNTPATCSIPGHPELIGKRFEISPGAWYATCDSAFALYQYGDLGLDPDFDLGDNDDDDYYFSYASECGISMGIDGAFSPKMSADTTCNGWFVHVVDTNVLDKGLSQIELLKDPEGVLKRKPGTDSGYVSTNVDFLPKNFTLVPGVDTATVQIVVDDPLKDADAYVWAVNVAGNDTLIYLHYQAPKLKFYSTQPNYPDSAVFYNSSLGFDTCTQFVIKNSGKTGEKTFTVTGYTFANGSQGFRVTDTSHSLPYILKPGDSVVFSVCFNASQAVHLFLDTFIVNTNCPKAIAALFGTTGVGEIETEDFDFGPVILGQKKCHGIKVWNTGKAAFKLTKQWLLDNNINFDFIDTSLLPITIDTGILNARTFTFCYTPTQDTAKDTTIQHWASDLPEPFTHLKKDFSNLYGYGIKPDLSWNKIEVDSSTICDSSRTFRLYLRNHGTASILMDSVAIKGPDAAEFKIAATQGGVTTATFNPEDSIWVDVLFTPNLSKPLATRWNDRFPDTLIAYDDHKIDPIVVFNINVNHPEVTLSSGSVDLGTTSPGTPTGTKILTVTNTGKGTPLIIDSLSIDAPFSIVQPGSLKLWDTIQPGKTDTIILQGLPPTANNYTGNIYVGGMTSCASGMSSVTMSASNMNIQAVGHDFGSMYLCTNGTYDVYAYAANSSVPAGVVSVKIVDNPAFPGQSKDFTFSDGTQVQTPTGVTLQGNQQAKFSVVYTPSAKRSESAWIIYTFDTVSNPNVGHWSDTLPLTGTGLQEFTTISVANPAGGRYIAQTGSTFDVPIQLVQASPFGPNADVHTISFDLTYRQDLFQPVAGNVVAQPGYQVISANVTSDVGGWETMHIVLAASGNPDFTGAADVAHVKMQLMVTRDTTSTFTVSNVTFQNTAGNTLCYVLHDTIPALFTPQDLCGNSILRGYVATGAPAFGIRSVHPNPATSSVHVTMDIRENNLPMTIELYNAVGQVSRNFVTNMPMPSGHRGVDLDVSGLPSGSYSLRITSPEHIDTKMIIIQK